MFSKLIVGTLRLALMGLFLAMLSHSSTAQVGLLSTNNKDKNKSTTRDTSSIPILTITRDPGIVAAVRDTHRLNLSVENTGIDTVQQLKSVIISNSSDIKGLQTTLSDVESDLLDVRRKLKAARADDALRKAGFENQIKSLQRKAAALNDSIKAQIQRNELLTVKLGNQALRTLITDTLNAKLLGEILSNLSDALETKLNTLKKQNENLATDLYKNQYSINSYWFLIDSTKESFDRTKFMDTLSGIYSAIRFQSDGAAQNMSAIQKSLDKLYGLRMSSETAVISSVKDYADLRGKWQNIAVDTTIVADKQRSAYQSLQSTIEKYNGLIKNNIKDRIIKKEEKTTDFGAFPQLTSILGKKEVVPQLQLYGSYVHKNTTKSFEGNIGLSFAPTNAPDTSNLYSLFIASASKFLVQSNFTWSFATVGTSNDETANLLGIRLEVNFANKNLVFDTTKTVRSFSSSLVYTKAGIEFGILPRRLSVYANLNTATILDKVADFEAATGLSSQIFKYSDCGARFYLDPTPNAKVDDKLFVYANINCIINGRDVRKITRNEDVVIPSIQVGIVKSLGKF